MELAKINNIDENLNFLNKLNNFVNSYLIVLYDTNNISFIGDICNKNKYTIKKTLESNDFYEVGKNLYRIIFKDSIYLFKKYEIQNKILLVGSTIKKTNDNRLQLIHTQAEHLLQKSETW